MVVFQPGNPVREGPPENSTVIMFPPYSDMEFCKFAVRPPVKLSGPLILRAALRLWILAASLQCMGDYTAPRRCVCVVVLMMCPSYEVLHMFKLVCIDLKRMAMKTRKELPKLLQILHLHDMIFSEQIEVIS